MSLRIQNNIDAFNAHRQLVSTGDRLSKSMERLASGYRINRAADDSAGLAISVKLQAQIGGVEKVPSAPLAPVARVRRSQRASERRDAAKPREGRRDAKRPPPREEGGDGTAPHVDVLA